MGRKNPKTGAWEWTEDDEQEIAKGVEVRLQTNRLIEAEKQSRMCKRGTHDDDGEGKCAACGAVVKKTVEETPKPKGKHLLTM
jgi:hypothetical protein